MNQGDIWYGLSTFLSGSFLTGLAGYFGLMRNQLTKQSHADICLDKQTITSVQLAAINATLIDHGKKLDRILMNGKGGS